ncbi:helix-turn-helix domain-containing protein [Peribacillus frigoritolerans]|uniref:helix-turn-helix domain-containing protein n=1 Tax=Peribacillus frigoritolerans TaxID=450367 RepID=UPI003DA192E1
MSIGKNIKKYRKKLGFTQMELATKANISRSYLGDVENERYNVSLDVLGKIAKALNIDISVLLNETNDTEIYHIENKKEKSISEILSLLRLTSDDEGYFLNDLKENIFNLTISNLRLDPAFHNSSEKKHYEKAFNVIHESPSKYSIKEKQEILQELDTAYNYRTIKHVLEDNDYESIKQYLTSLQKLVKLQNLQLFANKQIKVPVLGSVKAGIPIEQKECIGYEIVGPETVSGREVFGLLVKEDSMVGDGIYNGDTVIVVKQREISSSDIAVVAINEDEATLKRVKCEGEICMLMPSNPSLQPSLVPIKDVFIIGKVIQSRRYFE